MPVLLALHTPQLFILTALTPLASAHSTDADTVAQAPVLPHDIQRAGGKAVIASQAAWPQSCVLNYVCL